MYTASISILPSRTVKGSYRITLKKGNFLKFRSETYLEVIAKAPVVSIINLGGPELDGYITWLQEHDNKSPLYWNEETSGEPTAKVNYFK